MFFFNRKRRTNDPEGAMRNGEDWYLTSGSSEKRVIRQWRKFGLTSKHSMGKWALIAKEQGGDQWMEYY